MPRSRLDWVDYNDQSLLDLRLCDLGVRLHGSGLEDRVERLHEELDRRELRPRPHTWLSSEWFSPDGVPGIAIPFFREHRIALTPSFRGDRAP